MPRGAGCCLLPLNIYREGDKTPARRFWVYRCCGKVGGNPRRQR